MANTEAISWNPDEFEKTWITTCEKIVKELMADSDIEEIKQEVRSVGHVTDVHKDKFITKVNEIKNKIIEAAYGKSGSDTYVQFVHAWQNWQKQKGIERPKPENMFEDNINHLLFGSTPNPDLFLKDFDIHTDVK